MSTVDIIIIIYIVSVIGVWAGMLLDYKFSKYPNIFVYPQMLGLSFVPVLNTFITVETIYAVIKEVIIYFKDKSSNIDDNKDETDIMIYDCDFNSMYPDVAEYKRKDKK